jgi:putative DNA primase/helicase
MSGPIPFEAIQAAALSQAEQLLGDWFPAGRKIGREFKIGNLRGDPGESLSINLDSGKWADFADGASGHDLIDLRAAIKHTDRVGAARELAETLGIKINGQAELAHVKPNDQAKPEKDDWQPIIPPPAGAPLPDQSKFYGYSTVHEYLGPGDKLLFYVRRREATATKRKQFHPLVYGTLNGKTGWHSKHPAPPRPLYGLNRLTVLPDASVLLCEGEKAANAAQELFPIMPACPGAEALSPPSTPRWRRLPAATSSFGRCGRRRP